MRIGVPRETAPRERRVALTPAVAGRLVEAGFPVVVEPGAGEPAAFPDDRYRAAGAELGDPWGAEVVVKVAPPSEGEVGRLEEGTVLIGFLEPLERPRLARRLAERGVSALAVETIPRITRAQPMDALSSQATAAGYQAALVAAARLGRFFPMLTTAAGTVRPARVLVLGAGVAGLQAIATARRLGARVAGYDVRPAAAEQVESLGARFIDLEVAGAEDESGYAREVGPDEQERIRAGLRPHVAEADAVITTAQLPGRPAPLLLTEEVVAGMEPGSVVVDLAAPTGGNCALTRPDEEVVHAGVLVLGPTDLPSGVASHASQMYARNLAALLEHLVGEGEEPDLDRPDEILAGCLVAHRGEVVHPRVRELLAEEEP